nr:MAG TPA: hypothetical protein [Caudoviricetes sp.]
MGGPHVEGIQLDQQDQDLTLHPIPPVRRTTSQGGWALGPYFSRRMVRYTPLRKEEPCSRSWRFCSS